MMVYGTERDGMRYYYCDVADRDQVKRVRG